jgi:HD-like signal output (HDOD) protein
MKTPQSSVDSQRHPPFIDVEQNEFVANSPALIKIEQVLLSDEKGSVQVLLASNRALSLSKLTQQLQRDLLVSSSQARLITTVAASSDYHDGDAMLTVVDESLLHCCPLYMYHDNEADTVQGLAQFPWHNDMLTQFAPISEPLIVTNHVSMQQQLQQDQQAVVQAVSNFTVLRMQQRLEETLEIPPLPITAQAVIDLRADPNADVNKLCQIVQSDPSLAAQVVSWASSSYYAAPGKVKSVQDAIVRVLGYDLVMNLSLGLALGKTIHVPQTHPIGVTPFWQQSVYMAAAMGSVVSVIARQHRPSFGLAYLTGLLHNFGYLVLAHTFETQFVSNCGAIEINPHLESYQVELLEMGISQEQIASCLLQAWNMQPQVYSAIRFQHEPEYRGEHHQYALLLYICRQMLRQQGLISGPIQPVNEALFVAAHLDPAEAVMVFDNLADSRHELDAIVQVMSV